MGIFNRTKEYNISKSLKIYSWNVNGLRSIEQKKALYWVDKYKPDILCLQETRLSSENKPLDLFKQSYSNISINNSLKKGLSGTVTYSNLKIIKENFCSSIDNANEGRIIEQHYNNLIIFNVYFPNGKRNESRLKVKIKFYKDFFTYCETLKSDGKSIIICGDFNTAHKDLDLKKTKINNRSGFTDLERTYFNKFIANGYLDSYRLIHGDKDNSYTWWSYRSGGRSKNEGWRIDYILISDDLKDNLQDAFILTNIMGSDHCPIGIKIDLKNIFSI